VRDFVLFSISLFTSFYCLFPHTCPGPCSTYITKPLFQIFVEREGNIEVGPEKEKAMAIDKRRNHHDGNAVMQPGSSRSPKTSQNVGKPFSFRNKNEREEYGDSKPEDLKPSTSRSREYSSSNRKESKTSSTRSRSYRSSDSSDRSPTEYYGNELKGFVPSKAMRRNSLGSNFYDDTAKAKRRNSLQDGCVEEYPIRFRSTDHTHSTRSATKVERRNSFNDSFSEELSISYMSNDHSDHSESKTPHSDRKEYSGNEHKITRPAAGSVAKARLRNSCDKEHKSPKPSKARQRNSCDYNPKSLKPSKARRRNSCDYDPKRSKASTLSGDELKRGNSWNDSYTEEHQRQSKAAKQKQPRRLKSIPMPGNNSKSKTDQNKVSSWNKTSKKRNSSSNKYPSSNTLKETQKNQPKSIRLNSQLMRKIGDFRPYFVPLKKKQEFLNSPISETFSLSDEIVSHTVNDGPAQILHEGMKNISVASFLHEGVPVVKVSHNKAGKLHRRILTLSEDQTTLFLTHSKLAKGTRNMIPKQPAWTPSKGWNGTYIRAVDVANICEFQVGVISTRRLELSVATHAKKVKKKGGENQTEENNKSKDFLPYMPDPAHVASAVTIFHIDSTTGRMDSLDFFIENQDHRRAVVATLALMTYTYSEASQLVGNEILLYRYILKDMNLGTNDKGMTEMNEMDFLALCRRLNFTAQNVGKEFREFFKQHTENYVDESSGKNKKKLPIHECLQLIQLLKGKENPPLAAWKACFGTATCVNAATVLIKLLHGPQQEQTVCDIQDARDLVNIMNATELGEVLSNRKGSLLTQWQFQEFLRSEWNDIYDPENRVIDKEQLLDKPLSHYWINSSFCTSSMSNGIPSIQSYTRALSRGCKSIDLNCWDGTILPNGECVPIIIPSNGNPGTSFTVEDRLTFRSVVLVVRKYLLENRNSYPIMFNLENNCSQPFQQSMVKTMQELFGKHLFVPTKNDRKKELPSPEKLRGKIVVNARMPVKRDKNGVDSYRSKSFTGDAYSKMFNQFNTVKPDSFRPSPPESASRSFSSLNHFNTKIGAELMSLSLFNDVKFSGYFLESMDLTCSDMHCLEDIYVPKIVKEYSDNPELWRKFNESHCKWHMNLFAYAYLQN
jgi:hypothetical protein